MGESIFVQQDAQVREGRCDVPGDSSSTGWWRAFRRGSLGGGKGAQIGDEAVPKPPYVPTIRRNTRKEEIRRGKYGSRSMYIRQR